MDAGAAGQGGDEAKEPSAQAQAQEKRPVPAVEIDDAPDPDEDDLDDLDDMLEEFSSTRLDPSKTAAQSGSGPATSASAPAPEAPGQGPGPAFTAEGLENLSEEEFEKQLQAGMADLMNDLENSPDMQAQFEDIFKGLGAAASAGGDAASPSGQAPDGSANAAADNATFQETIRRTMAKMQESGDQATAAAAAGSSDDDFIAEMMKAMKDLPTNDGGSEEDFSKMLMGMMEQLTNKEILYEPMKELNDKYPDWLAKHKDTLKPEDLKRYQEQQVYVAEMVSKFEEPSFSDANTADRQYIVERMQKMQEAGSPPHDLIGDMPSAKEVLDAPDESCAPQ